MISFFKSHKGEEELKKNGLFRIIIVLTLFVIVAISLLVFPGSGNEAGTNIFELIFRETSDSIQKEEVAWQAMGSTVAQDDDEEEFFSSHANIVSYHMPSDIIKSFEVFGLFIFFGIVIELVKYVFCVMSGPFGGNSPPKFLYT